VGIAEPHKRAAQPTRVCEALDPGARRLFVCDRGRVDQPAVARTLDRQGADEPEQCARLRRGRWVAVAGEVDVAQPDHGRTALRERAEKRAEGAKQVIRERFEAALALLLEDEWLHRRASIVTNVPACTSLPFWLRTVTRCSTVPRSGFEVSRIATISVIAWNRVADVDRGNEPPLANLKKTAQGSVEQPAALAQTGGDNTNMPWTRRLPNGVPAA
jgi:hypothetical protein